MYGNNKVVVYTEFSIIITPGIPYNAILHHWLIVKGVSTTIPFPFPKGLDGPGGVKFFLFLDSGVTFTLKRSPRIRFGRLNPNSSLSKT